MRIKETTGAEERRVQNSAGESLRGSLGKGRGQDRTKEQIERFGGTPH